MPGVDQLRPEERAVIELILRRGQSYGQIGDALGVSEGRAAELARGAVARLEPSAPERPPNWTDLADHVLGQQTRSDSVRTRASLEASPPARAWARGVASELRPLRTGGAEPWVPPEPASRRRGPVLALVLAVALLGLVGLAALAVLTADEGSGARSDRGAGGAAPGGRTRIVGQVLLHGVGGSGGRGLAGVVEAGGRRRLVLQVRPAPGATGGRYLAVLANSRTDRRPLTALISDGSPTLRGAGPLPGDAARFRFLEVAREDGRAPGRVGRLLLRGPLPP